MSRCREISCYVLLTMNQERKYIVYGAQARYDLFPLLLQFIAAEDYTLDPTPPKPKVRPKKRNCLFPVTVRKKNRVGRSVKKIILHYFFGQKLCFMHVLR